MSGEYTKVSNNHFWEDIVRTLDFSDMCPSLEKELESFLEMHRVESPYLLIATHSLGDRQWTATLDAASAPFFEDPGFPGEGWHVFREEDISCVLFGSATSGSKLEAVRQANRLWSITLTVPLQENGEHYKGAYWNAFHRLLATRYHVISPA